MGVNFHSKLYFDLKVMFYTHHETNNNCHQNNDK
jgi:hypothetical protein